MTRMAGPTAIRAARRDGAGARRADGRLPRPRVLPGQRRDLHRRGRPLRPPVHRLDPGVRPPRAGADDRRTSPRTGRRSTTRPATTCPPTSSTGRPRSWPTGATDGAAPDGLSGGERSYSSSRSGCWATIQSYRGWNCRQPARVPAGLAGGLLGHVRVDEHRGAGRLGEQLRLAGALHRDEPPGRLVDGVPDGEQAVVRQDGGLAAAEGVGDALALLEDPTRRRCSRRTRRGRRRTHTHPG